MGHHPHRLYYQWQINNITTEAVCSIHAVVSTCMQRAVYVSTCKLQHTSVNAKLILPTLGIVWQTAPTPPVVISVHPPHQLDHPRRAAALVRFGPTDVVWPAMVLRGQRIVHALAGRA